MLGKVGFVVFPVSHAEVLAFEALQKKGFVSDLLMTNSFLLHRTYFAWNTFV